jgi:hypothetical protein
MEFQFRHVLLQFDLPPVRGEPGARPVELSRVMLPSQWHGSMVGAVPHHGPQVNCRGEHSQAREIDNPWGSEIEASSFVQASPYWVPITLVPLPCSLEHCVRTNGHIKSSSCIGVRTNVLHV